MDDQQNVNMEKKENLNPPDLGKLRAAVKQSEMARYHNRTEGGLVLPAGVEAPKSEKSEKTVAFEEFQKHLKDQVEREAKVVGEMVTRIYLRFVPVGLVFLMQKLPHERNGQLCNLLGIRISQEDIVEDDAEGKPVRVGMASVVILKVGTEFIRIGAIETRVKDVEGKKKKFFTSKVSSEAGKYAIPYTHPHVRQYLRMIRLAHPLANELYSAGNDEHAIEQVEAKWSDEFVKRGLLTVTHVQTPSDEENALNRVLDAGNTGVEANEIPPVPDQTGE